jgi:hypothetical protein
MPPSLASETAVTDESSICGMPCIAIDVFADHTAAKILAAGVGPAANAAQVRFRVKLSAGSVRSSRASASRGNCLPSCLVTSKKEGAGQATVVRKSLAQCTHSAVTVLGKLEPDQTRGPSS